MIAASAFVVGMRARPIMLATRPLFSLEGQTHGERELIGRERDEEGNHTSHRPNT